MKIVRSIICVGAFASLSSAAHARTSASQPTSVTQSSSSLYDVQSLYEARDTNRYRGALTGNSADGSLCGLTLVATCKP